MLPPKSRTYWLLTILAILLSGALVIGQEGSTDVQEEKWALIVGISDYQNVNDLQFADNDAEAMYKLLTEKAGFTPQSDLHTTYLLNEKATKTAIMDALERKLTKAKPDDLILIYFSGHGSFVEDTDGDEDDGWDEGLVPYDAVQGDEGSMIIDDEFGYKIKRLKAKRVIVILDACYSGGAGKTTNVMSVRGEPTGSVFRDIFTRPEGAEGRILLTASQPDQVAHERPEFDHGLFTYFLLEALEGKGDENRDGAVTIQEAFTCAEKHVDEYVKEHGLTSLQTPIMKDQLRKEITITLVGCPKLVGTITVIIPDKEIARQDDEVLINLGTNDDIQIGDMFEAYHEYSSKAAGSVKETRGRIKIIEILGENRSLAKVIKSKIPIEAGDRIKRICKFKPSISEDKPPEITSINFPSQVTADGEKVKGIVNFRDPDSDITKVEFNVLESKNFDSFGFNPEIKGQTKGSFEFSISTMVSQKIRLEVCLVDSAGNRSKGKIFFFQTIAPVKPGAFKILDLAIEPSNPVVGKAVTIRATVKNSGGEIATKLVKLYVKGVLKDSSKISIKPNNEEIVSFSYSFPVAGQYLIKVTTPDSVHSRKVVVQRAIIYNQLSWNKDNDRLWDNSKEISGVEPARVLNTPFNRKFLLESSDDGEKVYHKLVPIRSSILDLIGKTTINTANNQVELEGKGFIRIVKANFSLREGKRRLEFRTWDGKLIRSESKSCNVKKVGNLFHISFGFKFINTEALEILVIDILTDVNGKALAVATTEIFKYKKIFSVKTITPSGFKHLKLNIPPNMRVFSFPAVATVNEKTAFGIWGFDSDGKFEKLKVDWGDGKSSTLVDPPNGKIKVSHRYKKIGTFTVSFTGIDNEGRKANFSRQLRVVRPGEKEQDREEGEGGDTEEGGTLQIQGVS